MTKEDKELLLQDLCARLPYGVMLSTPNGNNSLLALVKSKKYNTIIEYDDYRGNENDISEWKGGDIEFVKPYLRPMSSMTEEEMKKLKTLCLYTETEEDWEGVRCSSWGIEVLNKYNAKRWDNIIWVNETLDMNAIDWLNKHHFDYRGLIKKGLAIEVTEENNPYKE